MSLVIHEGQIRIRIVRNPTRVGAAVLDRWEFRWRDATGRRRRLKRARLSDAKKEARRIAKDLAEGRTAELSLADVASFRAARLNLVRTGMTLEAGTAELADVHRRLEGTGITPIEAADFARRHHADSASDKPMAAVVAELLKARRADGAGELHLKDLSLRLNRFAGDLQCTIAQLNAPVINDWLTGLDLSSRSKKNYRGAISNLIDFAIGKKYLPPTYAEMRFVKVPKEEASDVQVFTIDEMRWLLRHASQSLLPVLVLGGFAGLRTSETLTISWEHIHWNKGLITVPGVRRGQTGGKTGKRLAELFDNAKAWLEHIRARTDGHGRIVRIASSSVTSGMRRAAEAANKELAIEKHAHQIEWKHNALRHSFITYWSAFEHDLWKISERTGHSVQMLKKHYQRQDIIPETGRAWFEQRPERRPGEAIQLSLFGRMQNRAGESVQTSEQKTAADAEPSAGSPIATEPDEKICPLFAPRSNS